MLVLTDELDHSSRQIAAELPAGNAPLLKIDIDDVLSKHLSLQHVAALYSLDINSPHLMTAIAQIEKTELIIRAAIYVDEAGEIHALTPVQYQEALSKQGFADPSTNEWIADLCFLSPTWIIS